MTDKIGLFGGSFDPVHNGHILLANAFTDECGLTKLFVIPTRISPLKNGCAVSAEDRIQMLRIAFEQNSRVVVSDIELTREGVSYTCDTIAEFKRLYPSSSLHYCIGDDWLSDFERWKNFSYILKNVTLCVANRSGNKKEFDERCEYLKNKYDCEIIKLQFKAEDVSSTELRRNEKSEFIPEKVKEYIKKRGLYR